MMRSRFLRPVTGILVALGALSMLCGVAGAIPAFPGAEGYGAVATGGRGGDVYHVTSLADTDTVGTLRYGLKNVPTAGRTIVFDVSGTIALASTLRIDKSKVTIAGQTAPGDGICLRNEALQTNADNLIIRHIRSRVGDLGTSDCDAIWGRYRSNIILDHCDASWSIDECLSLYANNANVTVQYCMATESLYHSHHSKGNHGMGGIAGGNDASWHHNLYAHNSSRNPRFAGDPPQLNVDFRNNVIYNWGYTSAYGGENGTINMVNNYFKYGPATDSGVRNRIVEPSEGTGWTSQWYIEGNYVYGYPAITADNWAGGVQGSAPLDVIRAETPAPYAPVYTQTAEEAFAWVLANVGAFNWDRDTVDARIINEVLTGTATYGGIWGAGKGIIDSQTQVGGWPTYPVVTRPGGFDTDNDGMPDYWETARGLNPSVANNNADYDADGYTDLEEYLVWLAPIPAPKAIVWTGGTAGRYELINNWDIPWQPSALDRAEINSGKATVGYIGQEAGTLTVANTASSNAELAVTAGSLAITNRLILGNATGAKGTASLTGGSLTAGGAIVLASAASSTGELKVAKGAFVQVGGLTINTGSGRSSEVGLEVASDGCSLIHTTAASTLGGVMDVQSLSDFRPREGDKFAVIASSDPNGVHFVGNFTTFTSNITLGLPGPSAFGGAASGANYELTFLGYTHGDADGDHKVDGSDLALMGGAWSQGGQGWSTCDFTGEGVVNASDLALMGGNWMWSLPGGAPSVPIPEPASAGLLAGAGLALIAARPRHQRVAR